MTIKRLNILALIAAGVIASAGAKTVSGLKAGGLSEAGIDPAETSLTIQGTMNAADFAYILDKLPKLSYLDISGVTIDAYNGAVLPYTGMSTSPASTLPDYSLTGLSELKTLKLPASLKKIGRGSLSGSGITDLRVPDGVTTIGDYAAMRCETLESVSIPGSVTEIGQRAFAYCPALTNVLLDASVTALPEGLFEACVGLSTLNLEALAHCEEIGPWALAECDGLTALILPAGTRSIEKGALYGAGSLDTLQLPADVEYLGDRAMANQSALNVLNVSEVTNIPELGEGVWNTMDQSVVTLVTPDEHVGEYRSAEQWKEFNVVGNSEWKSSTENIAASVGSKHMDVSLDGDVLTVSCGVDGALGTVSVYNAAGLQVATAAAGSHARQTFRVAGWPKGVYLVVSALGAAKVSI